MTDVGIKIFDIVDQSPDTHPWACATWPSARVTQRRRRLAAMLICAALCVAWVANMLILQAANAEITDIAAAVSANTQPEQHPVSVNESSANVTMSAGDLPLLLDPLIT